MSVYAQEGLTKEDLLEDCDSSDIECPQCHDAKLLIFPEGTSPDDYTEFLICPACGYEEKE